MLRTLCFIALTAWLTSPCAAAVARCHSAPREISAFGALPPSSPPASVSDGIRFALPRNAKIRQVQKTNLSPSGEKIVIYDASTDELEPFPAIAFVVADKMVASIDLSEAARERGGFAQFLSACEYSRTGARNAVAVGLSSAGDGAGSAFAIIAWRPVTKQS